MFSAALTVCVLPLIAWEPGEVIGECPANDTTAGYVKGLNVKRHAGWVGEYVIGTLTY